MNAFAMKAGDGRSLSSSSGACVFAASTMIFPFQSGSAFAASEVKALAALLASETCQCAHQWGGMPRHDALSFSPNAGRMDNSAITGLARIWHEEERSISG